MLDGGEIHAFVLKAAYISTFKIVVKGAPTLNI